MEQNKTMPVSAQAQSFFIRMLVKTALKAIIWCIVAAVITYFWPSASWVWYVVLAFVCIGLAAALLGKGASAYAKRQESDSEKTTEPGTGSGP